VIRRLTRVAAIGGGERGIRNLRTHGVQCVGGTLKRVGTQRESAGKRVRAHVSLNRAHPRAPFSDNGRGCVMRTVSRGRLRLCDALSDKRNYVREKIGIRGERVERVLFTRCACERGDLSP